MDNILKELCRSFTRAMFTIALIKCVVMYKLDREQIKTFTTGEILTPFVYASAIALPFMLTCAVIAVIIDERKK